MESMSCSSQIRCEINGNSFSSSSILPIFYFPTCTVWKQNGLRICSFVHLHKRSRWPRIKTVITTMLSTCNTHGGSKPEVSVRIKYKIIYGVLAQAYVFDIVGL